MSTPRYLSPLRYPGGKARMAPALAGILERQFTRMDIDIWMEPFAGGAGAGLWMLETGTISELWLVEKHPALATFWQVVAHDGDALAREIELLTPTLRRWHTAQETLARVLAGEVIDPMQVALATFLVNRCSRSGIVAPRSGPIGGARQDGAHRLTDRWNGLELAERIRRIADHGNRGRLRVHHGDAIKMIADLPGSGIEDEMFLFVDPPYLREGTRLYQQGMDEDMHARLAAALSNCDTPWILTYDDEPAVRDRLYPEHRILQYRIANTANQQRLAWEYAVLGHGLAAPERPFALLPNDENEWVPIAA